MADSKAGPSTPPRPRTRMPWGWIGVGAACLAGGVGLGWWITREGTSPVPADPDADATPPSLSGRSGGRTEERGGAPKDPFADAAGPMRAEEALVGLRSRLEPVRHAALVALLRRGVVADPEVLAIVREMAAGPHGKIRAWAQAVLMKAEGTRTHLRELAERAAGALPDSFYEELVKVSDPASGEALLRATRAAKERSAKPGAEPLAGLEEAIAALAESPAKGAEAIAKAMRASAGGDEPTWLAIAAGVRPAPAGVVSLLAERVRGADAARWEAAYGFLLRTGTDLSVVPEDLAPALATHLASTEDPVRGASMRALGRLPTVDPETLGRIVRAARDGEQASLDALIALRHLGPKARPRLAEILALEPVLSETGRFLLAEALLAIGGEGVGAYAARRLPTVNKSERSVWLKGAASLAAAPDGRLAAPAIASFAASDDVETAEAATAAIARFDPALADARHERSLAASLVHEAPALRLAAVEAVASLAAVPESFAEPFGRLLADPHAAVRRAVVRVLAGLWRLGPKAAPLVPAVVVALGLEGEGAPDLEARVGLLRTLAAAAPDGADARAAFVTALRAAHPDERIAGLWGLSKVATPTAEEKAAVARLGRDPVERVGALAYQVLGLPVWR
jgi:hypothetical protein